MKNRILSIVLLLAFSFTTLWLVPGCDITNPTDGLAIIVKNIERETSIAVSITDIKGATVTSPLTVTITGADTAKVISETNLKKTTFTTSVGNFNFAIAEGTTITESNPIRLVVNISSNNQDYLDVSYPVTLTSTGFKNLVFNIVKKADLSSAGVEHIINQPTTATANNSGALESALQFSTSLGNSVSVPIGSVLRDANNNPLVGNLSVSVTNIGIQGNSLFPKNEVIISGMKYKPTASLRFEITDQSGRKAASSSNTINLTYNLENQINPATMQQYKVGDTLHIFEVDNNGNVQSLGSTTVGTVTMPDKKGMAFGNLNFLGINWGLLNQGFNLSSILLGIQFNSSTSLFFGLQLNDEQKNLLSDYVQRATISGIPFPLFLPVLTLKVTSSSPNNPFTFANIPITLGQLQTHLQNTNIPLASYELGNGLLISSFEFTLIPNGSNLVLNSNKTFASASAMNRFTLSQDLRLFNIKIQLKCPTENPNNPQRINPNATVYVKESATNLSMGAVYLQNGQGGILLKDGAYTIISTYDNEVYTANVSITNGIVSYSGTNVDIEPMENTPANTQYQSYIWYYMKTTKACF